MIINSIPSGKCTQLTLSNSEYFYACGNSFYNPNHLISLPSPIISFSSLKYHFLLTREKLYQVNIVGEIITTMKIKKKCVMIKIHNTNIILFYESCYEIYEIPIAYQTTMYKLISRVLIESSIMCVDFYENLMVCGCDDNSIRIYNIGDGELFLGSYIGRIIDCFIDKNKIIVVAGEDIFYYEIEIESVDDVLVFKRKIIMSNMHLKQIQAVCYDKINDLLFIGRKDEQIIVEIYKGNELILTPTIESEEIDKMCVNNNILGVISNNLITICDYANNTPIESVDTSEINSVNTFNDLLIVGSDKSIRIYKEYKQVSKHKITVQSKIIFLHATRSILITISSLGTVKLYDIQNFHCFKTFDIERITLSSETNEDGTLLFLSNTSILIYDTKRGAVIDELLGHSGPIIKMKYKSSFLYSLGMDNFLRKQYIYDTKRKGAELENINRDTIIDFDLNQNLYLLTKNEVIIYDTEFNYIKSIILCPKGKMIYDKISVVNDSLVSVSGKSKNYKDEVLTYLQIYSTEHAVLLQSIVSEDMKHLISTFDTFLLHTNYGLKAIGQHSPSFDPIDIEINCTPENVEALIQSNKLLALISSVKMNDHQLVLKVINKVHESEISTIIRYFPKKYISPLRIHVNQIENNLVWVKNIIFWHTGAGDALKLNKNVIDGMRLARLNHYIINAHKRREK